MTEPTEMTFVAHLAQHPILKARFLEVAENAQGDLIRVDEAEQRAQNRSVN